MFLRLRLLSEETKHSGVLVNASFPAAPTHAVDKDSKRNSQGVSTLPRIPSPMTTIKQLSASRRFFPLPLPALGL